MFLHINVNFNLYVELIPRCKGAKIYMSQYTKFTLGVGVYKVKGDVDIGL